MKYNIQPLGDLGVCISWGNKIDASINKKVLAIFDQLRQANSPGVIDLVPAYSSLSILFDNQKLLKNSSGQNPYELVSKQVEKLLKNPAENSEPESRLLEIPVCYDPDFAPDLEKVASQNNLDVAEVVRLHSEREYLVYMLGFLPGFPYMGIVDERIATPRLSTPRREVPAGSVGIAGNQTGIYPLNSPGGWNLIGRTPVKLFDPNRAEPVLFQPGDRVRFKAISRAKFQKMTSAI